MSCSKKALAATCTISLIFGLIVTIVGGWACYIKVQTLEELHPNADKELGSGNHYAYLLQWNQMKSDWKNVQSRDLATIGIAIASGVTQFVIAVILIHSMEQASSKTIASRYILSNIVIMFVLLICNLTTVSTHNMNVQRLPSDLKSALGLEHSPLLEILFYGINIFNIWIGLDFVCLFFSIVTLSCFLRSGKSHEMLSISRI